ENTRAGFGGLPSRGRIELPMAASVFPHEIFCPPKAWAEALWPNLFYWNELDKGGHFAAFEQPTLFTEELRKAFRSRRAYRLAIPWRSSWSDEQALTDWHLPIG